MYVSCLFTKQKKKQKITMGFLWTKKKRKRNKTLKKKIWTERTTYSVWRSFPCEFYLFFVLSYFFFMLFNFVLILWLLLSLWCSSLYLMVYKCYLCLFNSFFVQCTLHYYVFVFCFFYFFFFNLCDIWREFSALYFYWNFQYLT